MIRRSPIRLLVSALSCVAFASFASAADLDVSFRELPATHVVVLDGEGDPGTGVPATLGRLMGVVTSQSLTDDMSGMPFTRYRGFDGSGLGETTEWAVGAPFAVGTVVEGHTLREIPAGRFAVTVHRGSYHSIAGTWEAFFEALRERGVAVADEAFEVYVDDPTQVAPDQVRTELRVRITD